MSDSLPEITFEDTEALWVALPVPGLDGAVLDRWAQEVAKVRMGVRSEARAFQRYIRTLSELGSTSGAWTLAYAPSPDVDATLWDISFLPPQTAPELDGLLGRNDPPAQLAGEVAQFEAHGLHGHQHLRFELDDKSEGDETAIAVRARVVVTRELPGLGDTTIVADADSALLQSLMSSVVPLQHLLTSDTFAALVADTQTPPGDRPGRPSEASAPEPGSH